MRLLLVATLAWGAAHAQKSKVFNFDGELVRGELVQPKPMALQATDDAELAQAEKLFAKGDLEEAIVAYKKVAAQTPALAPYADYKRAWALLNLGRLKAAEHLFKKLSTGAQPLAAEAAKDLERVRKMQREKQRKTSP